MKKIAAFGRRLWVPVAAAGSTVAASLPAHATLLTDTQTAITSAQGDALTVGGYVVAAVGALIVVGLVLGMVHKLR